MQKNLPTLPYSIPPLCRRFWYATLKAIHCHWRLLQIVIGVKCIDPGHALVVDLFHGWQILFRLHRVGFLHRLGAQQHAVVERCGVGFGRTVVTLLVFSGESFAGSQLVQQRAALSVIHLVGNRIIVETAHFRRADAVAAQHQRIHAKLFHLTHHRAALWRIAAVENRVRLLRLDGGQDGGEIGRLVVGEIVADNLNAVSLGHFGKLFRQTLDIGSTVIDDRDFLDFQFLGLVQRHLVAQLAIASGYAEYRFEALQSHLRIGRNRAHHDTGIVVDERRRYRHTRVVRTDYLPP